MTAFQLTFRSASESAPARILNLKNHTQWMQIFRSSFTSFVISTTLLPDYYHKHSVDLVPSRRVLMPVKTSRSSLPNDAGFIGMMLPS